MSTALLSRTPFFRSGATAALACEKTVVTKDNVESDAQRLLGLLSPQEEISKGTRWTIFRIPRLANAEQVYDGV